ncbi:MAG: peptide-methionine (R)-S-oxide reductase [Pseudomonadota bacterium]
MNDVNRRNFLGGTALAAVAATGATKALATTDAPSDSEFQFEIQRSEEEWRSRLTSDEYRILREGKTEKRHSSPYVNETREGVYHCKGCNLAIYDNLWKVPLDIGWVFFRHSRPRTVLTGIDGEPFVDGDDVRSIVAMEVHCRRCASHLGHVVHAQGNLVHCINGSSLVFESAEA